MLDPHLAYIEAWLVVEPRMTALTILSRLSANHPSGPPQQMPIQRLLKALRAKSASQTMAATLGIDPSRTTLGAVVSDTIANLAEPLGNIVR